METRVIYVLVCVSIICRKQHVKACNSPKAQRQKEAYNMYLMLPCFTFTHMELTFRCRGFRLFSNSLPFSPASVLMYSSRSDTLEIHSALKQFKTCNYTVIISHLKPKIVFNSLSNINIDRIVRTNNETG